ncbi:maleylpyruvate isomerase N-terminal domain-containing protein [Modestobacter sp. DSM 44400]|uniref:maleylpyruvate isomerase N-terminal domain-containing protein n=1 Tax=Modestobacter sp. DSM 44400 TaxID=1550230 RepID=UPI000B85E2E2|nr:maleylpyruvate isomerase N-terminal domain-containing protein [Modestobacter sp. DSM 44400]
MDRLALLEGAYVPLSSVLGTLDTEEGWRPTGCAGWAVLDLIQHLLFDTQRALVALATPADVPADADAVGYWRAWQPTDAENAADLWRTRVTASASRGLAALTGSYAEATAAVLVAASRLDPAARVRTQGHVLRVGDLLSTLAVEAAVHHLDLVVSLDRPGPGGEPLAEVRMVLTELAGGSLPRRWDDATAARRGTGRSPLTAADRLELGPVAARFPLFG